MSTQCCWQLPPPCSRYEESRVGTCAHPTCLRAKPRKRGEPRVAELKASAKAGRALQGPSSATRGCQEASVVWVRRRSWRRVSSEHGRPVALGMSRLGAPAPRACGAGPAELSWASPAPGCSAASWEPCRAA